MGSFARGYFEWEKGMCTYIEDGDWAPVIELETV